MKWRNWSLKTNDPDDFLPILVGCTLLFIALPGFFVLLLFPDENAGGLAVGILVLLGIGIVFGLGLVIVGLRSYATPGSLAYRLSHGRFFRR